MKLCVLDIETNIHTGKPVVVTLLTPEDSVELLTVAENNFGILKDFLADPEVVFLGHNIAFDFAALQTHLPELRPLIWAAYEAGRISDTMIREKLIRCAEGTLDDHANGFSLAALASKYLGESMEKGESSWQLRFCELEGLPAEQYPVGAIDYCKRDVRFPKEIRVKQTKADGSPVDDESFDFIVNEIPQCRAALALQLMTDGGVRTDPATVERLEKEWRQIVLEGRTKAKKYFKTDETRVLFEGACDHEVAPRNTALLQKDVKKFLGRNTPLTDKGAVRVDEDTLSRIDDPAIQALCAMAGTNKLLTSFLPVLKQGTVASYLRPSYDILKATGRTSCKHPNAQQLPRKGGVRDAFIPREGYTFIECDYSGIEMVTLAQVLLNLFGESKLADALNSGKDIHLVTSASILRRSYEDLVANKRDPVVKNTRQMSKAANFGFPGGSGAETFLEYAWVSYGVKLSLEEAKRLKQSWLNAYPEMRRYFAYISEKTALGPFQLEQHYSRRLRGGCGYCDGANSYFQGLAADGAKLALWRLAYEQYNVPESPLYGCIGGMFIHDEVILEAPVARAAAAAKRLGEVMVESMRVFTPDVLVKAEPLIMNRLYKDAEPVYNSAGELVPWEPKK